MAVLLKKCRSAFLDLLFPPKCAFCGRLLEKSGDVCGDCGKNLPYREEGEILSVIGEQKFPCAVALYYEDMVRDGIKALKFGRKSWRAKVFARYIAQVAAEQLGGTFDAVTFVPVSRRRNFERGFDQARLLAEAAGNIWGVRAEPVLRKLRHTRAQSSLDDPAERKRNVEDAYAVLCPERVRGCRFLLIDDVCTTGSTLAAAAGALMEAGAAGVVCAALAGGSRKTGKKEKPKADFGKI